MRISSWVRTIVIVIWGAACGGSSPTSPDSAPAPDARPLPDAPPVELPPDAAPDAPPPVPTITVDTQIAPALIAYRNGVEGPWQAPTLTTSPSRFTFNADGPYAVIVVCDDGGGLVTVDQLSRTPGDGDALEVFCASPAPSPNDIKGHMVQAGEVVLGDFVSERSATPDWDFTLQAPDGVHDLVATTIDRVAIRRGVVVNGPTTVSPVVDLSHEGFDLVAAPFTAPNSSPMETLNASVSLETEREFFASIYRGPSAKAVVAPNAALIATDRQAASVSAALGPSLRSVKRRPFREADSRVVMLPDALGPLRFTATNDTVGVMWSTLPDHDDLSLTADAFSSTGAPSSAAWFYTSRATKAFEIATGATNLALDLNVPGFKPAWRIDFTAEYRRSFNATLLRTGELATSSWSETIHPGGSLRDPARRGHEIKRASMERRTLRDPGMR